MSDDSRAAQHARNRLISSTRCDDSETTAGFGPVMKSTTIDQTAHKLFTHLWRSGKFAYFWTAPARRSVWFEVGQLPPIPTGEAVYFGVNPVGAIPATNSKGEAKTPEYIRSQVSHIAAVNALFAEFDIKDYGSSETIHDHLKKYPSPTVKVFSGGGYHCYWLLDDPFIIANDAARQRAIEAQANWVDFIGGDKNAKDLARVLRVPGTVNRKPEYGPNLPTVEIIETQFVLTYDLVNLEAMSRPAAKPKPEKSLSPPKNGSTIDDSERAAELLTRLDSHRADDYQEWLKVGMSLSGLGNVGLDLWDEWSKQSQKYQSGVCAEKWPTLTPDTGVTFGSLVHWANEDDPRPIASNGNVSHPDSVATALPEQPPGDDAARKDPLFPHFTLAEGLQLPEADYLVYGAIEQNDIGMIYGDAAAGKTYLAIDLAVSMAASLPWMGRWNVSEPRKILYFIAEGRRKFFRRILAAVNGMGQRGYDTGEVFRLVNENMVIVPEVPQLFNKDAERHVSQYAEMWRNRGRPPVELFFIDTLHRASVGSEENDSKDAGIVIDAITWLQSQLDSAGIFVHHSNKTGGYRGSSAYRGNVDFVFKVEGVHREPRTLTVDKLRDGEPDGIIEGVKHYAKFMIDPASDGTFTIWFDPDEAAQFAQPDNISRKREAIVQIQQALTEAADGLSKSQLAGMVTTVHKNTAIKYIDELIAWGEIITANGDRGAKVCTLA